MRLRNDISDRELVARDRADQASGTEIVDWPQAERDKFMACILERSGVAHDPYEAMRLFAGGLPGGVAVQTTLVAIVMAAMTGIVGGEIVLLGLIALPQMLRLGDDRRLAIGIICAGGSCGTMIPPSVVLIVYGLTASVPVGELFLAPGIPDLDTIFRAVLPFIVLQLVGLALLLTFPQLALWLPRLAAG